MILLQRELKYIKENKFDSNNFESYGFYLKFRKKGRKEF